jgi:hypothetical protein
MFWKVCIGAYSMSDDIFPNSEFCQEEEFFPWIKELAAEIFLE